MTSILDDFKDPLRSGRQLAVMPISRLHVCEPMRIGDCMLYAAGEVDIALLRPIPNRTYDQTSADGVTQIAGQHLRESLAELAGFNIGVLESSTLIAFPVDEEWQGFLDSSHSQDIKLIRRLGELAERTLDLIRFEQCRFDIPDSLPGRAGSWDGSGPYRGALVFDLANYESWLIAGPTVTSSIVVRGIGLEVECVPDLQLPTPQAGEVGAIARHGLSLFTDVLEANSETHKFMRVMTLLEYLATPDDYLGWKKAKKEIVCHIASDKKGYHQLCDRFQKLSSHMQDDQQRGLRTLIVHHGQYLEDILPQENQRSELFFELHEYCWGVLHDMLTRSTMSWDEFREFRKARKRQLGVAVDGKD